ncbi:MAG: biotin synthase BioB [Burkholderiales bacterium]|nr:biotin synthase BioB [Burkholderiales bacterium]
MPPATVKQAPQSSASPVAAPPAGGALPATAQIEALFALPFADLLYRAQGVHRASFDPNAVQLSTLLSVKTGGCPEDCGYCPQSAHHATGVAEAPVMALAAVVDAARAARVAGATRFCMGAAWRGPKRKELEPVLEMVRAVKALGLETCATLGLLRDGQAEQLREAGLDYYNHNLDTAPDFYGEIVSTRTFGDRLATIDRVRRAGIRVCCGGIVGMGESRAQRAALIAALASLEPPPESVPINMLVRVEGTPLADSAALDWSEFVRTIAVARIAMPASYVRLSAGRQEMSEPVQALCFLAGANSIFYGERLLTTGNPETEADRALLDKLGMHALAEARPGTSPNA